MEADFNLIHLLLLAFATFRISRFLIEDHLFSPVRERIWAKWPPETSQIGYFFTCYWCTSIWGASLLVICYILVPVVALIAATILALSAFAGIIEHLMNR